MDFFLEMEHFFKKFESWILIFFFFFGEAQLMTTHTWMNGGIP